jgi:hypothetical protein
VRLRLLLLIAGAAAGCDGNGSHDGARGRCVSGGQILGECDEVATPEDACWKLVECGVVPVDSADDNGLDWGRCVERIERMDAPSQDVALACVGAASCDALTVRDSPNNPYEWPDCLEYP